MDELIDAGQILKKEEIGAELEKMLSKTLPHSANKLPGEFADEILAISDPLCDVACRISKYGCFAAGTPVYTDHGKESIENITISEKVLSYTKKFFILDRKLDVFPKSRDFFKIKMPM